MPTTWRSSWFQRQPPDGRRDYGDVNWRCYKADEDIYVHVMPQRCHGRFPYTALSVFLALLTGADTADVYPVLPG